jgi:hypothetical protein
MGKPLLSTYGVQNLFMLPDNCRARLLAYKCNSVAVLSCMEQVLR